MASPRLCSVRSTSLTYVGSDKYCKSTNFGVLLYFAQFGELRVFANICRLQYIRRSYTAQTGGRETPNLIAAKLPPNHFILRNAKFYSRQNLLSYSISQNTQFAKYTSTPKFVDLQYPLDGMQAMVEQLLDSVSTYITS